ncbi:antibiotic biosynthesis monooxygenase [Synechococcus sp. CBW1006]|uniref:antibiotic biosynthesis monooxygenase n=1 Tax=Synechococcus sp. CBW1006 TaxID=1353138 RepID=UPI0018CCB0E2|nr:antibiotic biosynthesis monooxygenase [Synechococcus sp. CBW1006]QPN67431.1 antibiotic biosynthesis monooxygenase [Synechococcus sp. CBW1006]
MADSVTLITSALVRPGMGQALAAWHARQAEALSRQSGFISTNLIPPRPSGSERRWCIEITFQSSDSLEAWQGSIPCRKLLEEAEPLLEGGEFQQSLREEHLDPDRGTDVTEVIFSKVKAGMSEQFRDWAQRIQAAQALYPGYLGMYLQPPSGDGDGHWMTILRYDSAIHLEAWMHSSQRAALLQESKEFMEREELLRISTSFPGWVPIDPVSGQGPPNWKTAMLVLLGLYPIVMLQLRLLHPVLVAARLPPAAGTFLANAISVALTSFLTMPFFVRTFDWWLFPGVASPRAKTRRGLRLIGLLYLLEILVLWKLLPF